MVKNLPANAGKYRDMGLIPGLGRSPEGGSGNPLQYSCLEKSHGQRNLVGYSPSDRKETRLSDFTHSIMNKILRNKRRFQVRTLRTSP